MNRAGGLKEDKMRKFILVLLVIFAGCKSYSVDHDINSGNFDKYNSANGKANPSFITTEDGFKLDKNLAGKDVGPTTGKLSWRSYYFDFSKFNIRPEYVAALNEHARYLLGHPTAKILLEGNADIRGSREYNIILGKKRADAVANFFKMQGIATNRIRALSYGAERPAALGHNELSYQINRRVDLVYEAK